MILNFFHVYYVPLKMVSDLVVTIVAILGFFYLRGVYKILKNLNKKKF
jgi:hypothetical protein